VSFVALALVAAAAFGAADFLGGVASQGAPAAAVVLWSKLAALAVLVPVVVLLGDVPGGEVLAWSVAAGLVGIAAASALYAALAAGPMSLVAPLTACSALLPAGVALAGGETASALTAAGMLAALTGAVLVTRPAPGTGAAALTARGLAGAVLAAVLLGAWQTLVQQAAQVPGVSALAITAVGSLAGVLALAAAALAAAAASPSAPAGRRALALPRRRRPQIVALGLLDAAGLAAFAAASAGGPAAPVAVLGALYPLATLVLARAVLDERLRSTQIAGVATALLGIALVSAGH
jgi:drug/metabolite transporter (DMT)-like permease